MLLDISEILLMPSNPFNFSAIDQCPCDVCLKLSDVATVDGALGPSILLMDFSESRFQHVYTNVLAAEHPGVAHVLKLGPTASQK